MNGVDLRKIAIIDRDPKFRQPKMRETPRVATQSLRLIAYRGIRTQ
jgi:hypothetical protein